MLREALTAPAEPGNLSSPATCVLDDERATVLAAKHCVFKRCAWNLPWSVAVDEMTEVAREKEILNHLRDEHGDAFAAAIETLPRMHTEEEKIIGVYNQAIAMKTRQGAPQASYSIDRKCLRKAALATSGDNIQSLVCFLCACVYPHRRGSSSNRLTGTNHSRRKTGSSRTT